MLDHLKDFRPKRRQQPSGGRSGVRTPIFSSLGFTTPGGSASPEGADYMTHRPQRSGAFTAEPAALEEGLADIDTDHEGDGKKKKRSSKGWFNSSGKSSGKKPVRNGSGESSRDGDTPDRSLQMESMHKKGEHTYPPVSWHQHGAHTPLRQGSPTASGSGTPTRRSEDGHNDKKRTDAVIFTAAKALKTVVLHDARNMRSATMDADLDTGLKFSNAHEAKVRYHDGFQKSSLYLPCAVDRNSPVIYIMLSNQIANVHILFLLTFTLRIINQRMRRRRSRCLIRMIMGILLVRKLRRP